MPTDLPLPVAPSPWAMQLAARVEKVDTPDAVEVWTAAVLAVAGLLRHESANEGGPWAEAVEAWRGGGKIRKLVRRGRASAWDRAQEEAGYTASCGRAEVRAFVPSPMDDVPSAVAKLQIQSTELELPEPASALPSLEQGSMVIMLTPMVEMSWGKAAAQCAHGGQLLWQGSTDAERGAWQDLGSPARVIAASESLWDARRANIDTADIDTADMVPVRDGGFTEIPAGTLTVLGWWAR